MDEYLIWSEEHGLWWNPNRAGYTDSMIRAGRYSEQEAWAISHSANGGGTFCEVPVLLTDEMRELCKRPSGGR
jgi:hypothetical protein